MISVLYTNCNSLLNKIDELRIQLSDTKRQKPMIICLTETWARDDIHDDVLSLDGYVLIIRKDRKDTCMGFGGGILVYASDALNAEEDSDFQGGNFNQAVCLKVKTRGSNIRIVTVYRSPNSNSANNAALEQIIRSTCSQTILVGDFNYRCIDWDKHVASDSLGRLFLEACDDAFLTQHVHFPT